MDKLRRVLSGQEDNEESGLTQVIFMSISVVTVNVNAVNDLHVNSRFLGFET